MTGKIYIVGIGPGSSEYLTKKAVDTVKASDYTVGSTRAIELFDDVNNKIAFNVKELLDKLEEGVQLACEGNSVSILSTGDPGFSGVLNTVNGKTTIALPSRKVKDMAQFLLDNGVEETRKVVVCERLSYPDERIVASTLKEIADSEFTYMCIMIIY